MSAVFQPREASDATATLFDRHHGRIRGYCLGRLRSREEADDAVQSTFLYAFAALQRGVVPREELPWLFTIASNVCRTRRRTLRRRSRLESGIDVDTLSDVLGREDPPRTELEGLGSSLAALPETQRRALLLREWQGLSYAEVAARLGLTESAVEAVLFRARRSLAQKLRPVDRVASVLTGAFSVRALRRLGSLGWSGKGAATAVAVGLAAGGGVQPLIDSSRPAHAVPARVRSAAPSRKPHRAASKPTIPVRLESAPVTVPKPRLEHTVAVPARPSVVQVTLPPARVTNAAVRIPAATRSVPVASPPARITPPPATPPETPPVADARPDTPPTDELQAAAQAPAASEPAPPAASTPQPPSPAQSTAGVTPPAPAVPPAPDSGSVVTETTDVVAQTAQTVVTTAQNVLQTPPSTDATTDPQPATQLVQNVAADATAASSALQSTASATVTAVTGAVTPPQTAGSTTSIPGSLLHATG